LEYFEMKKTLVALAALAVVSAASAQSTVTMYGVVDMGVAQLKDSNGLGLATSVDTVKNGIQQGTMTNSRIGFKGTEDLGGGLKANFVYELQTNPDENTQTLTNRLGTVGLSGNFGAVTIGRQYTPYHNVQVAMDLAGNLVATPGYVVNAHNFNGGRASNAVNYSTPSFGGFSFAAQVAAGATAAAATTGVAATNVAQAGTESAVTGGAQAEGKNYGLSGIYAAGPLVAGVAYNSMTNPNGYVAGIAPISGSSSAYALGFGLASREVKVWAAGASYDFTVVKASLAYSRLTDTKNDAAATDLTSNGYNFSIAAPIGATTLVANLGRASLKQDSSNIDGTITGVQLMANYALSKRTTAYAVVGRDVTSMNSPAAVAGDLTRQSTAVGVRHTF
jgi:predicted porin